MQTFFTILIVIGILILVSEASLAFAIGTFIPKEIREVYMNLDTSKMRLNPYELSILYLKEGIWVADTPIPILCKYYIQGVGTIPRWSKLHKEINKYYAEVHRKR